MPNPQLLDLIQYTGSFGRNIGQKKVFNYLKTFCDPIWIRTKGLLLRRELLYPAELWDQLLVFLK